MARIPLPRKVTYLFALAFITLCLVFETATPRADTGQQDNAATRRVVRMYAERFLFTPSEITVEAGTVLEIHVTSDDTDHGFRIVGTPINAEIPKRGRGEAVVVFEATTAGDYAFECSHMCGAGHGFMRGRIRVKPRAVADSAPGDRR